MARVDLHFHLLPGLDDGPTTIEESVGLARAAVAEGTRTIVATPHVRPDYVTDVSELPEIVAAVAGRFELEGIDLAVHCGAELGHDMVGRMSQEELETIAIGPANARWLLVETPFGGLDDTVSNAADELRDRGFAVVLAHPERSTGLLEHHHAGLRRELERGTMLQVNALSLIGRHGEEAEDAANYLVAEGLVEVIASDAHSLVRGPALTVAHDAVMARGISVRAARRLTDVNPARLLTRGAVAAPQRAVA